MADTTGNAGKLRIAAVGDIHVHAHDHGKWTDFFKEVSEKADVLLLCGDLTDTGKVSEAEVLAGELKACTIPVLAVLGNHDHAHIGTLEGETSTGVKVYNVSRTVLQHAGLETPFFLLEV